MAAAVDGPAAEDRPGARRGRATTRPAEMFGVSPARISQIRIAETELGGIPKRSRDCRTTAAGGRMRRDGVPPAGGVLGRPRTPPPPPRFRLWRAHGAATSLAKLAGHSG